MAFPSFSATCHASGTPAYNQSTPPLPGAISWQEAPSTGVASTNSVGGINQQSGPFVLVVYATADSWLSYGASPNSGGASRTPVPANIPQYYTVQPGDKFMWQAA